MTDGRHQPAGVGFQGATSLRRQHQVRDRLPIPKLLFDLNQATGLEPLGVRRKVAVGERGRVAKMHELLPLFNCQGGQDPQSARIGYERVKRHITLIGRSNDIA